MSYITAHKTVSVAAADGKPVSFVPTAFTPDIMGVVWLDMAKIAPLNNDTPIKSRDIPANCTAELIHYRTDRDIAATPAIAIPFPFALEANGSEINFMASDALLIQKLAQMGVKEVPIIGDPKQLAALHKKYGVPNKKPSTIKEWRDVTETNDSAKIPLAAPEGMTFSVHLDIVIEAVHAQMKMFGYMKGDVDRAEKTLNKFKTDEVLQLVSEMDSAGIALNHFFDYDPAATSQAFVNFYRQAQRVADIHKRFKHYEAFPEVISHLVVVVANGTQSVEVGSVQDSVQLLAAFDKAQRALPSQTDPDSAEMAWSLVDRFNRLLCFSPDGNDLEEAGIYLGKENGFDIAQRQLAEKIAANPHGKNIAQRALPQSQLDILGRFIGEPLKSQAAPAILVEGKFNNRLG